MAADRSQDAPSRQSLEALVNRLSDADLARPMDDGWTVAGVLAHLAFWDFRAALLVERWRQSGISNSGHDVEVINNAAKPQWLALQPRVAAELAVQAARLADGALDAAPAELVEAIATRGDLINVSRALHRLEHLDQIERALEK